MGSALISALVHGRVLAKRPRLQKLLPDTGGQWDLCQT